MPSTTCQYAGRQYEIRWIASYHGVMVHPCDGGEAFFVAADHDNQAAISEGIVQRTTSTRAARFNSVSNLVEEYMLPTLRNPSMDWTVVPSVTRMLGEATTARSPRSRGAIRRTPHYRYLTYMPHSSYVATAKCLSDADLKLARVSCLRTLRHLDTPGAATIVAVELWRGHEQSLVRYGIAIAAECRARGFRDTSLGKLKEKATPGVSGKPDWVFWPELQNSHRAFLLLQDERRLATSRINGNVTRYSYPTWCHRAGIAHKWDWEMSSIHEIYHATPGTKNPRANFYVQYGWDLEPTNDILYPDEVAC